MMHSTHSPGSRKDTLNAPCKYLQRARTPRTTPFSFRAPHSNHCGEHNALLDTLGRGPGHSRRNSGFSLIEVTIALGIFVFGALAIVQIFPRALGVVQNSEQRAVGQRMAQTTLARYNNNPLTVPEAIIDVDPTLVDATNNPEGWSDFPGAVFGTTNRNESLPRGPVQPSDINLAASEVRLSAAGRFRRVVGEQHRVGSGQILLRHPYTENASPANPAQDLRASRVVTVENVRLISTADASAPNGQLDFTDATVDGAPFKEATAVGIPSPPPTSHPLYSGATRDRIRFYVSYSWVVRTPAPGPSGPDEGRIGSVQDEPKVFPIPIASGNQQDAHQTSHFAHDASDVAAGGRVKVWFRSVVTPTAPTSLDAMLGRVSVTGLSPNDTVSIDYTVPDWRSIVVDDNLSTPIVSTPTNSSEEEEYLAERGYSQANNNLVEGRQLIVPTKLIADEALSNGGTTPPSQVYTLLQGFVPPIAPSTTPTPFTLAEEWSPNRFQTANGSGAATTPEPDHINRGTATPYPATKALAVRPKSGQIFFDVGNLISPRARVVYRNVDGWIQQSSVAARTYVPFHANITAANRVLLPREPWREYLRTSQFPGLIFHAGDAGQSLLVSYEYQEGSITYRMRDVPITVEREIRPEGEVGVPTAFTSQYKNAQNVNTDCTQVAVAYLLDRNGLKIGAPTFEDGNPSAQLLTITGVRGASLRVRSAWFDGSGYTQAAVVGYRSLDVESRNRS
jgi:type II secretory pathway pseudopilin PulG